MTDRNTKIPRQFKFEGIGKGKVIAEVAVDYDEWANAIQVLRFDDGKEVLRFCYYVEGGQLANRALWLDKKQIEDLRKELKKKENLRVRKLLQSLLE